MRAAKHCWPLLGALLLLAASGCSKPPPPHDTIQEYMEGVINPAGDFLFRSVEDVSDAKGTRLKAPSTDAEWKEVSERLAVMHAAPDVLTAQGVKVAPPGFKAEHPPIESEPAWIQQALDNNRADFNRRAFRLRTAADKGMDAVALRDPRALERALDGIDKACESCHLHYFYPNDKRAQQAAKEDGIAD